MIFTDKKAFSVKLEPFESQSKVKTRKSYRNPLPHHQLGESFVIDFTNYYNLYYTGPLYMGTSYEEVHVIYDTGSDWLVVETQACSSCTGVYDTTTSTAYEAISNSDDTHSYGDGTTLYGSQAFDTVCLSSNSSVTSCATDFVWFNVDSFASGAGLGEDEDGILGLSSGQDSSHGPLFIEFLYD